MVRCALPSFALALALTACGSSASINAGYPTGKIAKMPANIQVPDPVAWDGTPPASGTVTFIHRSPYDKSKFIAYEVDPKACAVRRTIEDELDTLQKLVIATISDPMDNAGTSAVIRPLPPPPPDGHGLVFEGIRLMNPDGAPHTCQPPQQQDIKQVQ